MENKPSPCLEPLEESGIGIVTSSIGKLHSGNTTINAINHEIDFSEDIPEEEDLLMEEEFIIWEEGTAPFGQKNKPYRKAGLFDDEEFGMPDDESLGYLAKCFTRSTFISSKKRC